MHGAALLGLVAKLPRNCSNQDTEVGYASGDGKVARALGAPLRRCVGARPAMVPSPTGRGIEKPWHRTLQALHAGQSHTPEPLLM